MHLHCRATAAERMSSFMQFKNKRWDARFLTELAVLTAIELVLELTGFGYLHFGVVEFTIMQVPVIIGAIVLGPVGGGILGTVFGLTSFFQCFGKSMFGSTLFAVSPIGMFAVCVLPRLAMGLVCAFFFRLVRNRKQFMMCAFSGLIGSLSNTVFFMGLLLLVFGKSDYLLSMGSAKPLQFVVGMVGIQGIAEAIICCVLGASISYALLKARK